MHEQLPSKENTMERKLPARAYYISSPDDTTVLLGLDVIIRDKMIRWYDTVKERMFEIGDIQEDAPEQLVFTRKDSVTENEPARVYTLQPLTLDLYNAHVKSKLRAGEDFDSVEKLYDALDQTYQNAW